MTEGESQWKMYGLPFIASPGLQEEDDVEEEEEKEKEDEEETHVSQIILHQWMR